MILRVCARGRAATALLAICLLLGACASGKQIVTGTERVPLAPEEVRLYSSLPPNAEIVALMSASCFWGLTGQRNVDKALKKLTEQAAALGANGLLIESLSEQRSLLPNLPFLFNNTQKVNAKALYVLE